MRFAPLRSALPLIFLVCACVALHPRVAFGEGPPVCAPDSKNDDADGDGGSTGETPADYHPNIGWIRSNDPDQDPSAADKPRSYQNCGGAAFLNDIASIEAKIPGIQKKEKGNPIKHPLDDPENAETFWDKAEGKQKKGYEYINRDDNHDETSETELVDALREYLGEKGFQATVARKSGLDWDELTKELSDGHDVKILLHETGEVETPYTHWLHVQSTDKEGGTITVSDPNTVIGDKTVGDEYTIDKEKLRFDIKKGPGDETANVEIVSKVYVSDVKLSDTSGRPAKEPDGPAVGNDGGRMSYHYPVAEQTLSFAPETITTADLIGGASGTIAPQFVGDSVDGALLTVSDFDYFAPTVDSRLLFVDGSLSLTSGAGVVLMTADIPNLYVDDAATEKVYGFLANTWINDLAASSFLAVFRDAMAADSSLTPMYSFRTDTEFAGFTDQFGFDGSYEFSGSSFITLNVRVAEPDLAILVVAVIVLLVMSRTVSLHARR